MPSLGSLLLPPPQDSREFEQIMRDYCSEKYSGNACVFARRGQKQYGVDVVSPGDKGIVAIQCKDYQDTKTTKDKIDTWISQAEEFTPAISHLIVAMADKTDGEIQKYVWEVSHNRNIQGQFKVDVVYWEEISAFIKQNPEILQRYYPFIKIPNINAEQIIIKNINDMRIKFVELFVKFGIQDFLSEDPFVGIKSDSLIVADAFDVEIENLLKKSVLLRDTDIYSKISEFTRRWNEYREYLIPYVQPIPDGKFVKISQIYINDFDDIKMLIQIMKDGIFKAYWNITS